MAFAGQSFRSAFEAAVAVNALGLSRDAGLALWSEVLGRDGLRYCPLAFELLAVEREEAPVEVAGVGGELDEASALAAVVEIPAPTEPEIDWQFEVPVVAEEFEDAASVVEWGYWGVPGEPVEGF